MEYILTMANLKSKPSPFTPRPSVESASTVAVHGKKTQKRNQQNTTQSIALQFPTSGQSDYNGS